MVLPMTALDRSYAEPLALLCKARVQMNQGRLSRSWHLVDL